MRPLNYEKFSDWAWSFPYFTDRVRGSSGHDRQIEILNAKCVLLLLETVVKLNPVKM